jgi:hypothetical protein
MPYMQFSEDSQSLVSRKIPRNSESKVKREVGKDTTLITSNNRGMQCICIELS